MLVRSYQFCSENVFQALRISYLMMVLNGRLSKTCVYSVMNVMMILIVAMIYTKRLMKTVLT